MIESIQDLQRQVHLRCFYTGPHQESKILESISKNFEIKHVAFNKDLTPFATKRDDLLQSWCLQNGIECLSNEDYTLHSVEKFPTLSPVFTPFMNHAKTFDVEKVRGYPPNDMFLKTDIKFEHEIGMNEVDLLCDPHDDSVSLYGTRSNALAIRDKVLNGYYKNYKSERDICALDKTTKLAVYMKFGLISIREVYLAVKVGNGQDTMMSQLCWREFYFHLTFRKPSVLGGMIGEENQVWRDKMKGICWKNAEGPHWKAWCEGTTGFPFVDAGMRQLVKTGEISNRVRMIVASFLTKNLMIDYKAGEQFFAKTLIDYDPCQNNGGWQWTASTGVDTRPCRIFNCWLQQKNFDPECKYVKRWIPELENVPVDDILEWERKWTLHKGVYYKPIVNHRVTSSQALQMFGQKQDYSK